jgi:hypothetical protein
MKDRSLPISNRLDWLDALRGWTVVMGVVLVHSGAAALSTGFARLLSTAGQYEVQQFLMSVL